MFDKVILFHMINQEMEIMTIWLSYVLLKVLTYI